MAQYANIESLKSDIETKYGSDFVGYDGAPITLDTTWRKILVILKTGRVEIRYYETGGGVYTDENNLPSEMAPDTFLVEAEAAIKAGIGGRQLTVVTSLGYLELNGTAKVAKIAGYNIADAEPISARSYAVWDETDWKARQLEG